MFGAYTVLQTFDVIKGSATFVTITQRMESKHEEIIKIIKKISVTPDEAHYIQKKSLSVI